MTIRVKIYIDGTLTRVLTDDIGEDQYIGLQNMLMIPVCGREIADAGNWSREVRWEVEVIK